MDNYSGLIDVASIIKELQEVSSTKAKEHILLKNKDNDTWKRILWYTYNDYNYGIKKTTLNKMTFETTKKDKWNANVYNMLEELAVSNINKELTNEVEKLISYFPDERIKELIKRILLKDLRCNINVKIINKVYDKLITTHDVQLASKFDGVLKKEVSMSLKLDGIRCSIIIDNSKIVFKSRQGKDLGYFGDIISSVKQMNLDNVFIDGELIRINEDNLPSDDNFRLTTQIVNSKSSNKTGVQFIVFDLVPIEDYYNKKNKMPYVDRLNLMETVIQEDRFVQLVPKFGFTKDVNVVMNKLEEVVSNNQEGLILNILDAPYSFSRTKDLLKVKKFISADVLVTDILEGEGRLEGLLGKIEVQFKYEGNVYTSYVGSGFDDEERKYYIEHKDELIGKVVEIKIFEISKNKKGEINFRFPIWKGSEYIRCDKCGIEDTNVD